MIIHSKNRIIKNALILSLVGFISKVLGFYYKIFLTNIIGVKELGIYHLIFPIFILAITISSSSISTAITKHTPVFTKNKTLTRPILYRCILFSMLLSFVTSLAMCIFSKDIATHILNYEKCQTYIVIISISIPFISIKSCINGFFLGNNNMKYYNYSHLIEQLIKIISLIIIANTFDNETALIGIIAMVLSEIISTLYSIFCFHVSSNEKSVYSNDAFTAYKIIIVDSIPLTFNNVFINLILSAETLILPYSLSVFYANKEQGINIYGTLFGIVFPFIVFPSTITSSLSSLLMPEVSKLSLEKNKESIKRILNKVSMFSLLYGILIWVLYYCFSEQICMLTFKSTEASDLLKQMSFLCPLIYLSTLLSSIINGISSFKYTLFANMMSILVRMSISIMFVPFYGITCYIIGLSISYIVLDVSLLFIISRKLIVS